MAKAKVKPRKKIGGVPVWCSFDKVVQVKDLKPNPDNPNTHPEEQIDLLVGLIMVHGWRGPITVSNRSGMIVRGHGRYLAAVQGGFKSVPVDFQDYESDEAEVLDLIADNKIAELSIVDDDLADDLIGSLNLEDFDPALIGLVVPDGVDPGDPGGDQEKPEVEFTQELTESHNYIVLYFDNDIDWLQAQSLFNLKTVKSLNSKKGYEQRGVGRVMNGAEALNAIMGDL